MAELPQGPPGAGRIVFLSALVWLMAILMARLVLTGTWGWAVAAAAAPVILILLRIAAGWFIAFVLTGLFAAGVLLLRAVLETPKLGWALFLVGILFIASVAIAAKVLSTLLAMRRAGPEAETKPSPVER